MRPGKAVAGSAEADLEPLLSSAPSSTHDGGGRHPVPAAGAVTDTASIHYVIYSLCMNGKEVIRHLQAAGFVLLRTRGSHHILGSRGIKVTVPVHGPADLKPGTLRSIEKQSGVKLT